MKRQNFFARKSFIILLAAVFLLPIALRGARTAVENNRNDVTAWLPDGFEETKELNWFREHFLGEQFVVISWEGCTLDDPRVEMLARKLVPDSETPDNERQRNFFKKVTTGPRVLAQMTDPQGSLKLSEKEAKRRLRGSMIGNDGETTCVLATLREDAVHRLREGIGRSWPITRVLMGREDGILYQLATKECAIEKVDIRMGGPPVDNVAIDDEGEITLMRLVGLSGLVGLCLSYFCFRSKRVTLMVFCCGVYGAACSLAIVYFTRGTVDAVLMTMPSVIYILGISGAIHLVNYYKDAVEESGVSGAAKRAIINGWLPCTLAAVTTAIGLISLVTSEVVPIRKFGTYTALGVMFTLAILFTLLPAFLELWPPRRRRKVTLQAIHRQSLNRSTEILEPVAEWILNRHMLVTAAGIALMLVMAVGLFRIETTVQLLKLFHHKADIIQDYTWLEENLGNLVPMEVVIRVDPSRMRNSDDELMSEDGHYRLTFLERMELVEAVQENVEKLPDVGRALSINTFAPVLPAKANTLAVFAERSGFNAGLGDHRDEFLASDYFRESENGEELFRVSARLAALSDVDYGHFVDEIRGVVRPVLAAYRQRDQILAELDTKSGSFRKKHVCVVGVPRSKRPTKDEPDMDPADEPLPTPRQILAGTLYDALRVAGVKVTPIYETAEGYEAKNPIRAGDENPKAQKFFGDFDLVFIAADHPNVASRFITRHAQRYVDARNFDPATVEQEDEVASGISPVYTGVVPLVYKAQRELLIGLIKSIFLAFVLICVVMMSVLRSPSAGLLSMIPNVFPIITVFGFMGWVGILVDIGTMMTASVAMGVAVDDTVHFLTWFRRGILKGLDRRGAVKLAYSRCATAMIQTTIIGGLGLGVFALSTFTPTQRFGYLMVVLLAAALVGDLVLLPALLAGPVGRFFTGRLQRQAARQLQRETATERVREVPAPHFLPKSSPMHSPQRTDSSVSSKRQD